MKNAEFEEKEYEAPLYNQLLGGSPRISTPGQVFEFAFGVDACLDALNPAFWSAVGLPVPPGGVVLDRLPLSWVWRVFGRRRRLPTFAVNLLIQAKRPDYLKGPRSDFKSLGIRGGYWRFFTTAHQQAALVKLSKSLGQRAMVVYASPAFHSHVALYQYTDSCELIENSTFVTPDKLVGHKSWNYDRPGTSGIAASILSGFNGPDFLTLLKERISESRPEEADVALKVIAAAVEETVDSLGRNPIATRYRSIVSRASDEGGIREDSKPGITEFQRSLAFFNLVGLTWFAAGPPLDGVEGTKSAQSR